MRTINYIGKSQKRHPDDHPLKEPFNLDGKTLKGQIISICSECKNKTIFKNNLKNGLNRFSISCGHCGGWRNIEIDYRIN